MTKKKQQVKKSKGKKPLKSKTKVRAAAKKVVRKVSAKRPSPAAKRSSKASRRGVERREFRRVQVRNLWVTELHGDYQFVAQARDISIGGIFLRGRLKTNQTPSIIRIQHNGQPIELVAQPVYDQVSQGAYGTAYRFIELSVSQAKTLKGIISAVRAA